jgi:7,8-dihydropterin-6-yl-methyl-4-(beta-D-ribofuranosyl)aminobenzene 5'-phosphate synthase
MKATLIYDNEVYKRGLQADWGFSSLIEVENTPKILFDTGANGSILLSNMEKLDIDPKSIEEVFISHAHWDHIGGLSDFLKVNNNVKVYIPKTCSKPSGAKEVIVVKNALKIHNNVFSTGELDGIEQSLCIKTNKGIVLIVGCSHPKMAHILKAASEFGKVYAIIGGLHGFREFELFRNLELICPCHCTQYKQEIFSLYSDRCIEGGAGRIIEV